MHVPPNWQLLLPHIRFLEMADTEGNKERAFGNLVFKQHEHNFKLRLTGKSLGSVSLFSVGND